MAWQTSSQRRKSVSSASGSRLTRPKAAGCGLAHCGRTDMASVGIGISSAASTLTSSHGTLSTAQCRKACGSTTYVVCATACARATWSRRHRRRTFCVALALQRSTLQRNVARTAGAITRSTCAPMGDTIGAAFHVGTCNDASKQHARVRRANLGRPA